MLERRVLVLCIAAACLATLSCQKLETASPGALAFEPARFTDAVPDDYGTLIAVTENPVNPAWVQLWFQRQDRTIVAVFVNVERGRISDHVLAIPRK